MKPRPTLSRSDELVVAGEAKCDPRTLRKALAGERVQPMTLERIREVLVTRGMGHLLP